MKSVFAYIRVSTPRQKSEGTSPEEQRLAIEGYAKRNGLSIIEWFEETKTAAKRGRPAFARMIRALTKGRAQGVVIHKIDRSARNPHDWAALGDLIDKNIDIHFVHESLDLRTRGGRLAANIQAVVAADFIRNLSEETRKGFYGRLRQGIYPLRAPIGYLDMGKGKPKEIDPIKGPLVRRAFELYATGDYNFELLQAEMHRLGLRGFNGNKISKNGLTTMLNNPFYIGLIHIRKSNELFEGAHPPLVQKALYDQVQSVLRGNRLVGSKFKHDFLFRRFIRCAICKRHLIGELKKGKYIYYRCHNKTCGVVCLNETAITERLEYLFSYIVLEPDEIKGVVDFVDLLQDAQLDEKGKHAAALKLRIAQCDERLNRLTDAYVDTTIDKALFENRKAAALGEKRALIDQLANLDALPSKREYLMRYLELSKSAYLLFKLGLPSEKRDLLLEATSNFFGHGKYPDITLKSPFQQLVDWRISTPCDPHRDNAGTRIGKILDIFMRAAEAEMGLIQRPQSPQVQTAGIGGPDWRTASLEQSRPDNTEPPDMSTAAQPDG